MPSGAYLMGQAPDAHSSSKPSSTVVAMASLYRVPPTHKLGQGF